MARRVGSSTFEVAGGCAVSEQNAGSRKPKIVVDHLTKSYDGNIIAVDDINLSIDKGEYCILFGPSGVGKSTLMRHINYLIKPTKGDIVIDGKRLGDMKTKELLKQRSKIGMIFQEFNLVNRMSVIMNVMCGRLHYLSTWRSLTFSFTRDDHERAVDCLRRAGLHEEELYFRRADTLSGGQKQRVAIARMLIQEPEIILADEPIAALDVKNQHMILELIGDIARRDNITIVMTLHHLDLAKKYASRIIGLSEGKVAFDGPGESLDEAAINRVFKMEDGKVVGTT